jgi:pimeloyl-ACP methyl ester carboxylesterase
MAAQGAFLRRFITDLELGESEGLVLIGSSRGGGIVLEAYQAMQASERERVRGMFLIAPAAHACRKPEYYDKGEQAAILLSLPFADLIAAAAATKENTKKILLAAYPDRGMADDRLAEEWAAAILPMYRRLGGAYFAIRINLDTWDELVWRERNDPADRRRYADVSCPVFVAWGEMDNALDVSIMLVLKDEIKGCEGRIVPGAGHDLLGLKDKIVLTWLEEFVEQVRSGLTSSP